MKWTHFNVSLVYSVVYNFIVIWKKLKLKIFMFQLCIFKTPYAIDPFIHSTLRIHSDACYKTKNKTKQLISKFLQHWTITITNPLRLSGQDNTATLAGQATSHMAGDSISTETMYHLRWGVGRATLNLDRIESNGRPTATDNGRFMPCIVSDIFVWAWIFKFWNVFGILKWEGFVFFFVGMSDVLSKMVGTILN